MVANLQRASMKWTDYNGRVFTWKPLFVGYTIYYEEGKWDAGFSLNDDDVIFGNFETLPEAQKACLNHYIDIVTKELSIAKEIFQEFS